MRNRQFTSSHAAAYVLCAVVLGVLAIAAGPAGATDLDPVNRLTTQALTEETVPDAPAEGLPFRRDPQREAEALEIALDDIVTAMGQDPITDPALRATMIEAIGQSFPLAQLTGALGQGVGLSQDDLADVAALRLGVLWVLANDPTADPGDADLDMRGLRDRIARTAAAGAVDLPQDDVGRQRLADLTLYAIVSDIQVAGALQGPARDGALAERFATLAGMAPDAIDLRGLAGAPPDPPPEPARPADASPETAFEGLWVRMGHGGTGMTFHPRMMFADGTATRDLGAPPDAFDIAASRAANPGDWGTWRLQGDRLIKRFPEDARDHEFSIPGQMFEALPAPADLRLEGRYLAISSLAVPQMGGAQVTAAWNAFEFTRDGRFANAGGMSSSAPGLAARALPPGEQGRYRIEGHAITLLFDDGREEARLFFQFPGPDRRGDTSVIGIGGTIFTLR